MKLAYIFDSKNLEMKDVVEFESFDFKTDIDYNDKSTITVTRMPSVSEDDFVLCKNNSYDLFFGVFSTYQEKEKDSTYTIILLQKECLFNRKIIVGDESVIETSIEQFVVNEITDNFVSSGDPAIDRDFIQVKNTTDTPVKAKVETENGIYNLKTYLGNIKQYYGIFTDFAVENGKLVIVVSKKNDTSLPIDTNASVIIDYKETYDVSVLAKLSVMWLNTSSDVKTRRDFFLLNNRTISEDKWNVNRAAGHVSSEYIEAESEEEMLQSVKNCFAGNQYNHKITFSVVENLLYPHSEFYAGMKCKVLTRKGEKNSIVTSLEKTEAGLLKVGLGNLSVTLIEKIRR